MHTESKQVFFDPHGRRSRIVNISLFVFLVASLTIALIVLSKLFNAPLLPQLSIGTQNAIKFTKGSTRPTGNHSETSYSLLHNRHLPPSAGLSKRLAFFSPDIPGSTDSLRRNAKNLDGLIPEWLELKREDGSVFRAYRDVEKQLHSWLKSSANHLQVYPRLKNSLSPSATALVLATPSRRTKLISFISNYLKKYNYNGITLTFRNLPASSHHFLASFLRELKKKLLETGRIIILDGPTDIKNSRYQELARNTDYLLINTHNETEERDDPGPVASQGWFESKVSRQIAKIDRKKLIFSIGSYGYDWRETIEKRSIPVQEAWELMQRSRASLTFDPHTLNPSFKYNDDTGLAHDVWYLDGVTVFNQLKNALSQKPAAIALWQLGLEDASVWASFGRHSLPDRAALGGLVHPGAGDGFYSPLKRNVIFTSSKGNAGKRKLTYNENFGLIVDQSMERFPSRTKLTSWPLQGDKDIVLTFDDGPNDKYTEKILDILAEKSVKGSFFIVGKNAIGKSRIMKRLYDEGHDIGSHSFSHPNLFGATSSHIELELNATQSLIESQLGIRTILFRAPYTSSDFLNTS
jgi:spore germination protein YaaH